MCRSVLQDGFECSLSLASRDGRSCMLCVEYPIPMVMTRITIRLG
jgi:hypothetical protein